jgi:hypothetical protein
LGGKEGSLKFYNDKIANYERTLQGSGKENEGSG